ncbi:efflux RND transporter periplasmic adaptor subunit [Marinilabilia salmonicolor]|jgi:HlyD family secretion protein|uniref:HlyD family secretion protein n=1 Tax=Marinilabilia salmonicolor TaxID=989 RepID=A0A2T0XS53_9BACT|nr:efflux RND transporter periplasmic adaptor subunit [Marinilabilia salmonicolor]PRZ01761.1 HlyD family secretion protein [Marinilabilia salmonicolor]RCW31337.1 HlyD family secretion protein [Marinilabilia salmonicolor]
MKKFFKILMVVVLIALVGWVVYYLYNQTKKSPVVFETQKPEVTNIIKKTVATGSIVPRKEIQIKPQESGIITEIYVQPGDLVTQGDLMAKIQIIPEMLQVNEAENRLAKARLAFENAKIEYERSQELYDNKVIPESQFLEDKLSFQTYQKDLESAQNNLELIKEGVIKKAGAQTNTLIRATTSGMVLDVPIEIGNSVIKSNTFNDGTTIALVADMGEMVFEGMVDETEVGKIKEGMQLLLTIGALDEEEFKANLEFISPKGVEENGAIQFEIKAAVELQEGSFVRAGYSATADIVLDRRDSVLTLQEKMITFKDDSTFVEIMTSPQVFEKRLVKTGLSDGINIEIVEGLSQEDEVKVPKS